MDIVWVMLITLFGVFAQTVSGFGIGLIMMPVLSSLYGLDIARPLATLIAITNQIVILYQARESITLRAVGILSTMALVGIPAGNWIAETHAVREDVLLVVLAFIIIGYALYALFTPQMPYMETDRWGGAFGFLSGLLTGAYNVGGPPIVLYADARRWTPDIMRSNLQGVLLFKSAVLLIVHAMSRNFTPFVVLHYLYAIPALIVGMVLGFRLYQRINAQVFRQIILVFLLLMGLNILWGVWGG